MVLAQYRRGCVYLRPWSLLIGMLVAIRPTAAALLEGVLLAALLDTAPSCTCESPNFETLLPFTFNMEVWRHRKYMPLRVGAAQASMDGVCTRPAWMYC
jgi:hypothetical protein